MAINGTAGDDFLEGGLGDDLINGLGGDDVLLGQNGDDVLQGGDGDDRLEGGRGADTLVGGDGDDRFDAARGILGDGADSFDGGAGIDSISYLQTLNAPVVGVTVDLFLGRGSGGEADGDRYTGIENVGGTESDDVLIGNAVANRLEGRAGDDLVLGGGGDDFLSGARGRDTLDGGEGNDTLEAGDGDQLRGDSINGGAGRDIVQYLGASSGISINLATGATAGAATGDTLIGIEGVGGSVHNDGMEGDAGANELKGFAGNDTLRGWGGADRLTGGTGRDLFDYDRVEQSTAAAFDTITDLTQGQDRIDLKTIDADAGLAGNQKFTFIGDAEFSAAGQVRAVQLGGETIVEANVDGPLAADLVIHLDDLLL